jgi:phosphoserine aminotransferase
MNYDDLQSMKSLLLLIIIILLTSPSFGQYSSYGFYRNFVIKKYKLYAKKNIYTIAITENDSSIFIHISGDTLYDNDKYFHLSSNGTCDREITSFSCEECFKKEIDFLLKDHLTKK